MAKKKDLMGDFKRGLAKKRHFENIIAYAERMDPKFVFSLDLPEVDLALFDVTGSDGKKKFGIAGNDITEISGSSSSFKTTMAMYYAADCIKQGGHVFWISSEQDISKRYIEEICCGQFKLDKDLVHESFFASNARSVEKVIAALADFETGYKPVFEEEGPRPVLFVLDSLAAAVSQKISDELDEHVLEGGDGHHAKLGEKNKLIHAMGAKMLWVAQEYHVGMLVTNHFRSNIGGRKKYIPAHDASFQFYPSTRFQVVGFNANKKKVNLGREWQTASKINFSVTKLRCSNSNVYNAELVYYYDYGFELLHSFGNTLLKCGVVKKSNKAHVAFERDGTDLRDRVCDYLEKHIGTPGGDMPAKVAKMMEEQMKEDRDAFEAWYAEALELCGILGIEKAKVEGVNFD